ncbi:hypothetical protein LTR85_000874 [Meristemomyces frigidus]|nr:hypothetical protein LTR85_000874 [Meristemomyces frigidus]
MLSSDVTVPSSPTCADYAVFSDEPTRASSPPSSPPGFPWEQQTPYQDAPKPLQKPPKTAFSLLGKRKALEAVSDNARLLKKPATTTTKGETKTLTQMQISLGQEVQKRCKTCGMEYVASSAEDRRLHDKYHKQNTEGYDVGKDFVQKARDDSVFAGAESGDSVCAIDCLDKPARKKKAQAVLEIVQRELGAVPIPEKQIWDHKDTESLLEGEPRYTAYMYIRGSKCVGFMLIEKIEEAYSVVEPASTALKRAASADDKGKTALSALKARKQATEEAAARAASQPIQLSQNTRPAKIGISRIWTSPTHRHQNIGITLLDTAVLHHAQRAEQSEQKLRRDDSTTQAADAVVLDEHLKPVGKLRGKDDVAFSQPTEAGARLARRWFGKLYGWTVYVD